MYFLFDVAIEPIAIPVGLPVWLLFLIVSLVEMVVLRLAGWGTWSRCARDAFLVNLVTTIVGYFMGLSGFFDGSTMDLVTGFVLSVLLESLILWLMYRSSKSTMEVAQNVRMMNVASYLVLFILMMIA